MRLKLFRYVFVLLDLGLDMLNLVKIICWVRLSIIYSFGLTCRCVLEVFVEDDRSMP